MEKLDTRLRLKHLINEEKITITEFARRTGISQPNISAMLSGKRPIGEAIINKIVLSFDISKDWLINGTGSMKTPRHPEADFLTNPSLVSVPLVGQYAYAGYLCGFADQEYIENLPTVPFIGEHVPKGEYMAFEVRGDSMEDGTEESIIEGDIIICRRVKQEHWSSQLHIRKWDFVIVHRTEGVLVKRIIKHDVDNAEITIHSLNSMYSDRTLKLNEVAQLFNVIQVLRNRKR